MRIDEVKRLKELEKENARLERLVADLSLDKAILLRRYRGETPKPVEETQDDN